MYSHLLFADDCFPFCRATFEDASFILRVFLHLMNKLRVNKLMLINLGSSSVRIQRFRTLKDWSCTSPSVSSLSSLQVQASRELDSTCGEFCEGQC